MVSVKQRFMTSVNADRCLIGCQWVRYMDGFLLSGGVYTTIDFHLGLPNSLAWPANHRVLSLPISGRQGHC